MIVGKQMDISNHRISDYDKHNILNTRIYCYSQQTGKSDLLFNIVATIQQEFSVLQCTDGNCRNVFIGDVIKHYEK